MVQDRKKLFHPSFLWLLDQTTDSVLVPVSTRSVLNVLSAGLFLSIACVGSMKPLLGFILLAFLSSSPQCAHRALPCISRDSVCLLCRAFPSLISEHEQFPDYSLLLHGTRQFKSYNYICLFPNRSCSELICKIAVIFKCTVLFIFYLNPQNIAFLTFILL